MTFARAPAVSSSGRWSCVEVAGGCWGRMAAGGDSGGGSAAAGAQAPAQGQVHDWVSSAEWQAASAAAAARLWGAGSDRPDLAKAYLKHFCERFEVEVARAHSAHNSASHSGQAVASGTHHHNGNADDEEHETTRQSHKYFFRRLSFKGLRRGDCLSALSIDSDLFFLYSIQSNFICVFKDSPII